MCYYDKTVKLLCDKRFVFFFNVLQCRYLVMFQTMRTRLSIKVNYSVDINNIQMKQIT